MPHSPVPKGGPIAPKTVTLKTIAQDLGVSVTTVARALKGGERISEEMVVKVKDAATRLGYVRNLDGMKLRTGQTFVVMAFLSFSNEEEIGDSGSIGLLNGIHQRFAKSDYAVRAVPVAIRESGLDKIKEVVNGRNADGIILDHTVPRDARVRYLMDRNLPFVTFGRTENARDHAYFDLDNEFAAYQGTKSLLDQGYRRIALIDADTRYFFVNQRVQGYTRALNDAGITVDPALVRHIDLDAAAARDAAAELAGAGAEAYVCVNELAFLGARAGVRRALGPDAAMAGFSVRSGTNLGAYLGSPLSTSFFSRQAAGWTLADLLLKRIAGDPVAQCQRISKTQLRLHDGMSQ